MLTVFDVKNARIGSWKDSKGIFQAQSYPGLGFNEALGMEVNEENLQTLTVSIVKPQYEC